MKYNIDKKIIQNSTDSAIKRFFEVCNSKEIKDIAECLTKIYDLNILEILSDDYFYKV